MSEQPQRKALTLTTDEATRLLARLKKANYLLNRGIEVYAVADTEPFVMGDGSKHPASSVMVRAEDDHLCGVGVGFVVAISEGLV
jgi:hypothetical protein